MLKSLLKSLLEIFNHKLSGQTSTFGVFFVFKYLLGIEGQKQLENFQF